MNSSDTRVGVLGAAVELLARSGRGGIVVLRGTSMEPTLPAESVVAVDFSPDRLRRGDLLLFHQADYLVVHRLLGRARGRDAGLVLRTRGDAAARLDPPVTSARVVGRVVSVRREGSWRGLRTRPARAYAAAVAVHALAFSAAGAIALRTFDRAMGRSGSGGALGRRIASCDRWLLALADRWLFDRLHPRVAPPDGAPAPDGVPGPA